MTCRLPRMVAVSLLACVTSAGAAEPTRIEAPNGAAFGTATGNTINIGPSLDLVEMQKLYTKQIVGSEEAKARAETRAAELAVQLGVAQQTVVGFFVILGEQNVPPEQIGLKLGEVATRYRELRERWSVFDTTDPVIAALAAQAKAALEAGRYAEADELLRRTADAEEAAARRAEQMARDAQRAAETRWARAAEAEGRRGDLAMTRLRYLEAADRYAAAASMLPGTLGDQRRDAVLKEAGALALQANERSDRQAALRGIALMRDLAQAIDTGVGPDQLGGRARRAR